MAQHLNTASISSALSSSFSISSHRGGSGQQPQGKRKGSNGDVVGTDSKILDSSSVEIAKATTSSSIKGGGTLPSKPRFSGKTPPTPPCSTTDELNRFIYIDNYTK